MRKKLTIAVAALFLAFVGVMFAATMARNANIFAYVFFKGYKNNVTSDMNVFDRLRVRIGRLTDEVNENIFLKDEMRYLNVALQKLDGGTLYEIGGRNAIQLSTGGYYDLFTDPYGLGKVNEIIEYAKELKTEKGIPTAILYCHSALYEDGLLDETYASADNNREFADLLVSTFRDAGLTVTDSRDAYRRAGLTPYDAVFNSDIHWTHRIALEAAADAVRDIKSDYGIALDETALDYSRFTDENHEKLFKGEISVRLGNGIVPADDIHVLYPAYETKIDYDSTKYEKHVERSGSFEEAVIERDKLDINTVDGMSTTAYYIYGDYIARTHTVNHLSGNDTTVLIFKDSFGTPAAGFFTLAAKNVYAVDLRSNAVDMREAVEQIQPDVVIFAYCQQTLRNYSYVIEN